MVKEKIKFGLDMYDYYKENGYDVLENIDETGFKSKLIFCGEKTKEQLDNELIQILFKGYK